MRSQRVRQVLETNTSYPVLKPYLPFSLSPKRLLLLIRREELDNQAPAGRGPESAGLLAGPELALLASIPPNPLPPRPPRPGAPVRAAALWTTHGPGTVLTKAHALSPWAWLCCSFRLKHSPPCPISTCWNFSHAFGPSSNISSFKIVPKGEDANFPALNVRSVHTEQPRYTIPAPTPAQVPPLSLNSHWKCILRTDSFTHTSARNAVPLPRSSSLPPSLSRSPLKKKKKKKKLILLGSAHMSLPPCHIHHNQQSY